jgi:hypothetical protein
MIENRILFLFGSRNSLACGRRFFLYLVLVTCCFSTAPAQQKSRPNLPEKVLEYIDFESLPEQTGGEVFAVVNNTDNARYERAIEALNGILSEDSLYQPGRSLLAWCYQWLAFNYSALDSTALAEKDVALSLEKDLEIWREYADFRLGSYLRRVYQQQWDAIFQRHAQKRKSIRLGLGTISRADFGYNYGVVDVTFGIGTPVAVVLQDEFRIDFFEQVLLYTRIQRMRKDLERLTPGIYVEFALLEENIRNGKLNFKPVVSAGPVLGYTYKSGWEIGADFEIIRLLLSETKDEPKFSQTAFEETFSLSFSNFEIYIRKWF